MSDNAAVKVVTDRGIMMNRHSNIMQSHASSNKLLELLEPHSSFRFQYRLLAMTTFYEIAVYSYFKKNLS